MSSSVMGFVFDQDGSIISYGVNVIGDVQIPVADLPANFESYTQARWMWNGTTLVQKEDFVEPVFVEPTEAEQIAYVELQKKIAEGTL